MATQEKLLKSLDYLRNHTTNPTSNNIKKKERIQHCHIIDEAISNPTIRVAQNFHSYLSITIEVLLQLCDDTESDVRMTAEECLNRIIRALSDGNIGKVQIELHKGIKRNGPARSLRAALTRFAQLVHLIRPNKGKPYVVNLFPALNKITNRPEEQIHETLASCLAPIMKVLGVFTSDNEIKELLRGFFKNIMNESASIRRSASSAVLNICLNCRKPDFYIIYATNYLLDGIIPISPIIENSNNHQLLGTLFCFKLLLPHLKFSENNDISLKTIDRLLQIYELCLYCLSHKDHNVINAALEALNILLQTSSFEFRKILLSQNGIDKSRLFGPIASLPRIRSPSQVSIAANDCTESELLDTLRVDIDKWIGESQLSIIDINCGAKRPDTFEKSFSSDSKSTEISISEFDSIDDFAGLCKSQIQAENSNNSSEKSYGSLQNEGLSFSEEVSIGSFLDSGVSLDYCTRLIAKSFLLSGKAGVCLSEKSVRVSMKSLAVACLSTIVQLSPRCLGLFLDRNGTGQCLGDVILYKDHPDPQLRGAVCGLFGNFIQKVLEDSNGDYNKFREAHLGRFDHFQLGSITDLFIKGLKDESSTCSRQALLSLGNCLKVLLESSYSRSAVPILDVLPSLALNPYWLVKVSLCELVSKLCFIDIYYVTSSNRFQRQVVCNVLLELLKEEDARVRQSSALALVEIIPVLYFEQYQLQENIVTIKAMDEADKYLSNICDFGENGNSSEHFFDEVPFPFGEITKTKDIKVEFSLSKILRELSNILLVSTAKTAILGCLEAFSLLSSKYPPTLYDNAWNCRVSPTNGVISLDLFNKCVNYLNSSIFVHDLTCHSHLLNLTSNLFAGYSLCFLRNETVKDDTSGAWSMLNNQRCAQFTNSYLNHILKLLNIFHYVLQDQTPHQIHSKVLPNLAVSSPLKRRKSDLEKKLISPMKLAEKDEKDASHSRTAFLHLPHYTKIFEILRSAYNNYKNSLQSEACEGLTGLLKQVLRCASVLLEIGGLNELQGVAEEILGYFRFIFVFEASGTVECVQQLLKSLFGTNLTAIFQDIPARNEAFRGDLYGFYCNIYQKPYEDVSSYFNTLKNVSLSSCDDDSTLMGYLHRKEMKSVFLSRSSDEILANYIRIFEPMVIKSLKLYTITSDVRLQCRVLQLLNQLIQLRVNYCLLDSEQIFIGFVLKQFEFIEEGQIAFADELIKRIFQFLVQLSHSKQHSKSIITIPEIIQLCDGLMASGQASMTHCIPAIRPIVTNIFLTGNKLSAFDAKELETTREVLLSTLLKLSKHKEVIDLIVSILNDAKYCKIYPEKWKRWSGQVFHSIYAQLMQNKIDFCDIRMVSALRRLIFALEGSLLRPIDAILQLMFKSLPNEGMEARLGCLIISLLVVSSVKEEVFLSRIEALKGSFAPECVFENFVPIADPLNVRNSMDSFQGVSPELIYVRFLFKVIGEAAKCAAKSDLVVEELTILLLYCIHLFQAGSHCKITICAISRIQETKIEETSDTFLELGSKWPILTFFWCYFMTVLNYKNENYWTKLINLNSSDTINQKIVTTGSVISFCNYMSENTLEPEQIRWFLSNCTHLIVDLCEEAPVLEFVSSIHRDSTTSKIFLDSIADLDLASSNSVYLLKIVKCVEKTHTSYTGSLLKLLLPKLLLLRDLTVTRNVSKLASRKVELLLTMSMQEVNEQLDKNDLLNIIKTFISLRFVKKYEVLSSLLNKLCLQYYETSPLDFCSEKCVNSAYIKKVAINRDWYLEQIKEKCSSIDLGSETVQLLSKLNEAEICDFIEGCDKSQLGKCLRFTLTEAKNGLVLAKVVVSELLDEVNKIAGQIPHPHQVYNVFGRLPLEPERAFSLQLTSKFTNSSFHTEITNLIQSINHFMEQLEFLTEISISGTNCDDLIHFGVIALELLNYSITTTPIVSTTLIDTILTCTNRIFSENFTQTILSCDENTEWLSSAINSLFKIVEYLLKDGKPLPNLSNWGLEANQGGHACHQLYILLAWIIETQCKLPGFLLKSIRGIIIAFSRLSLTNSYVLVPVRVWRSGWAPELTGKHRTEVPPLPIELLQETDILEEFIRRCTLLGWTSRQQFEETWMCFLSVLCGDGDENAASLALRAITALLLQTLRLPVLGCKLNSTLVHISRNTVDGGDGLVKLMEVQTLIETKCGELDYLPDSVNVFRVGNFEKSGKEYGYGQVSVRYLIEAVGEGERGGVWMKREKVLETNGLDINSCLQFLIDFYSQLLKGQITSLRMVHESVRSIVILSDLFTDKSQFSWMLEIFFELAKMHIVEDELLHQYLIVGISKAIAVLNPDLEIYENAKKILVQYLKSSLIPTRIACLHGLLYILEGSKLSNIKIGGISDEMQIILPCAVEYVQWNINSTHCSLKSSQNHTMLVWSLAFFLIENIDEIHMETNFIGSTLQAAFGLFKEPKTCLHLHTAVVKAMEKLLIKNAEIRRKYGKQMANVALDILKSNNPYISMLGLQLLVTYMYTDYDVRKERPLSEPTSPDDLVQTIEKITAIFEHIKRGYVFEVEILCQVLPNLLNDFFAPADILTKVISEFLSPQQAHPKLLSGVVFEVFEKAIKDEQLVLLQDWVVFSLSNITQSLSLGMETWCLTCFFISASSNEWLRRLFPYVQTRVGRYEFEDRQMLCIAGTDFYNSLSNDKQKRTFIENFNKIKNQSDTLFNDLLSCL